MKKNTLIFILWTISLLGGIIETHAQNLAWALGMGGNGFDRGYSVAVDKLGNTYVTGYFVENVDFNPNPEADNLITSNGGQDAFIAKYDIAGNYVWAKSIGGRAKDQGVKIVIDHNGDLVIFGFYGDTLDFDPGAGESLITGDGFFIAKYDTDCNFKWVKAVQRGNGLLQADEGDMVLDKEGNIHLVGTFYGTTDFDPGVGIRNLTNSGSASSRDIFMAKYDKDGNYVWANVIGGTSANRGYAIAVDASGNVYITGEFTGTADFNPGSAVNNLISNGGTDIYLAKYDKNGNYVWANGIGGTGADVGVGIGLDNTGNVYLTGSYRSTANFNPAGSALLTGIGTGANMFLAKYTNSGSYLWAFSLLASAGAMAIDAAGNSFLLGTFMGTLDFDPGPGITSLTATQKTSSAFGDLFVASYLPNGDFNWVKQTGSPMNFSAQEIVKDDLNNLHIIGYFNGEADFVRNNVDTFNLITTGSWDVFVAKMSSDCSNFNDMTEASCDSFVYNQKTYTASGVYVDTFQNAAQCDSFLMINLTINNSTIDPVITGQYCDSVTINGQTYTSSGTYTQIYESAIGCDSIVTLELAINSPEAVVNQSGQTLTANDADSYQWINCDNGIEMPDATSKSYDVTENGNYAVIITVNNCTDTSDCITVDNITDIDEVNKDKKSIRVYPNPVKNKVTVKSTDRLQNATIRLMNVLGQTLIDFKDQSDTEFTMDISQYPHGIYFIEIYETYKSRRVKIVKN